MQQPSTRTSQFDVPKLPSASTTPSTVLPVLTSLPPAPSALPLFPPLAGPASSHDALSLALAPAPSDAMQLLAATAADTMVPVLPAPEPTLGGSPERTFWNVVMTTDEPVQTRRTKRKLAPVRDNVASNSHNDANMNINSGNGNDGTSANASASTNSDRPWKCDRCDAAFVLKGHLSQHIKYVHFKVRPHACTQAGCGAAFGTQFARNQHVWTVHERLKPFACACGAKFGQRSHLNRHMKRCEQ